MTLGELPPEYLAWNSGVIDVIFSGEHANEPVYLDLEEQDLKAIAGRAAPGNTNPQGALVTAVRRTLHPEAGASTFWEHEHQLTRWRGRPDQPPPFIALLSVFSLAAELMRADTHFSSSNYYGRLKSLLGITDTTQTAKLQRDFQNKGHLFWEGLNLWLSACRGARGLPTARVLDKRVHVSLPISQALVRAADRQSLVMMFCNLRLEPSQQIGPEDMKRLIEDWLDKGNLSPTFCRLWQSNDAKERIAETACFALEAWDGTPPKSVRASVGTRLLLTAGLRNHPRRRLDFALGFRGLAFPEGAELELLPASDEPSLRAFESLTAPLKVGGADSRGFHEIIAQGVVSFPDLLFGNVRLSVPGGHTRLTRTSRSIVVLEYDDERPGYVEVERAELGRSLLVLVYGPIDTQVQAIFARSARPGFQRFEDSALQGLPEGWRAYQHVELLNAPGSTGTELAPLEPILATQLVFSGGLRLPGHAVWHRDSPPELKVASLDDNRAMDVCIQELETLEVAETKERSLANGRGVVIAEMGSENIGDGDYRITVRGHRDVFAGATVRFRSGDSPRTFGDELVQLAHRGSITSPRWAISATSSLLPDAAFLRGASSERLMRSCDVRTRPADLPKELGRVPPRDAVEQDEDAPTGPTSRRSNVVPRCISGPHVFRLPPVPPGKKRPIFEVACANCDYVRVFYPPRLTDTAQLPDHAPGGAGLPPPPSRAVAPIRTQGRMDGALILDALTYASAGGWGVLERIAAHVGDDPWAIQDLARLLSALGHLDIELDEETLRPSRWSIAPPVLVAHDGHDAVLCGMRSKHLIAALRAEAETLGGTVVESAQSEGPPLVRTTGLGHESLDRLAHALSSHSLQVHIEWDLPERLASELPPLDVLASTLPVRASHSLPDRLEKFDFYKGSWQQTETQAHGAYRLLGFPRRYLALANGCATLLDNRLVKWLGGREEGVPLLAYDESTESLICRLGAQLPGLYERAAVLCSGRPPTRLTNGTVVYPDVRPDVAWQLYRLLSG